VILVIDKLLNKIAVDILQISKIDKIPLLKNDLPHANRCMWLFYAKNIDKCRLLTRIRSPPYSFRF